MTGSGNLEIRLIALSAYPYETASTRYRIAQYIPLLGEKHVATDLMSFLTNDEQKLLYKKNRTLLKIFTLLIACFRLLSKLPRIADYDVVFISREIVNFGPPIIEAIIINIFKKPVILDIDDALWVSYNSPVVGRLTQFIKSKSKISYLIKRSSHVIVCNNYLDNYARVLNDNVTIIPTVVDPLKYHQVRQTLKYDTLTTTIGWIGSHSTAQYLEIIYDVLTELSSKYNFQFKIIGAGRDIKIRGVNVINLDWSETEEISELSTFDIGVYPIYDNPWSYGKCALKAIQYQAAGVACIASPVGMTNQVITHRVNGLLADTSEQWYQYLKLLITDKEYRSKLEQNGLENVLRNYSVQAHLPNLLDIIQGTCKKR